MTTAEHKLRRFVLLTALFAGFIFFTTTMDQFAARNVYQRLITSLLTGAIAFCAIWAIYYAVRFIITLFRRSK